MLPSASRFATTRGVGHESWVCSTRPSLRLVRDPAPTPAPPGLPAPPAAPAVRLRARALAWLCPPCTPMREHHFVELPDVLHPRRLPLVPIARGEGAWLIGQDGRRYLDAISSWWTNLFGHAEQRIAAAIVAQSTTLEHVLLAGFSHPPTVELAARILEISPIAAPRRAMSTLFFVPQ